MKGRISYKLIKYLLIAALILSLMPLLVLGFYAVPAADDFSYGAYAHLAFRESGSLLDAFSGALKKTVESYMSWQGTFSAIFLMALQPAVFSEGLYALTPFVMLAALIIGTFAFCRVFFSKLLGLERELGDIAAALILLISVQLMPSPVQGLYWFNGAVYYMFFHGLSLAACALAIALVKKGGMGKSLALCLMCLVLGGGNYVTALALSILAVAAIGLLALKKDRAWKKLLLPGVILFLSFALSIAAPGNAVRQAAQENTPGVIKAVLMSFENGIKYSVDWFSLPVAGMLLLFTVVLWPALTKTEHKFSMPLLLSVFSFCLFAAMFCPPIYAMGNVGDKRLLNMVWFAYLLLLTINLACWLGWLVQKLKRTEVAKSLKAVPVLLSACILAACCAFSMLKGTGFAAVGALSTLASGEARAYHDSAVARFEILKDESIKDVQLEPFPVKPYLLYFDDISSDPSDWHNEDISTYYGKESVVLK